MPRDIQTVRSCALLACKDFIRIIMSEYSDSEVDRIMSGRPPSSYGSMHSDDEEDDDDELEVSPIKQAETRVRLHRSDSPETAITERTQTHQSSIFQDGPFLRPQSIIHKEASPPRQEEPMTLDPSELQSDVRTEIAPNEEPDDGEMEEQHNESAAMEVQEEQTEEPIDDYDEIIETERFEEPMEPLPPPPEGAGLHYKHPHRFLSLRHVLSAMVNSLRRLHPSDLACFKRSLSSYNKLKKNYSKITDLSDALDLADKMIEICGMGEALSHTVRTLHCIGLDQVSKDLKKTCRRALLQHDLKVAHDRRYYSLYEGRCRPGQQRYISDVYVEPVTVIKGSRDPINYETEVQRIPYTIEEPQIRVADIFRPLPNDQRPIRTVMMTGIPACGLTVAVNKFIMDWTEGKTNKDFQLVFPIPARELLFGKDRTLSFLETLARMFSEVDNIKFIEKSDCLCLFIIDALEVCRHPLNFETNETITSARKPAPLDHLITSLIKGSLLPNARVWITGHVSAAHRIPPNLIDRFVELRGFTDANKEEYFTKRTPEPEIGVKVLRHMKRSKALEIICHLPLFSWMVAFIFERAFRDPDYGEHPPGITAFYSQYIVVQMNRTFEKYRGLNVEAQKWLDEDKAFLEKMGKMAFRMMNEGRDWFNVQDLNGVDLCYEDLRTRDGFTTEVKRESKDEQTWVFKFVHITIQDYMAAMYAYVAFRKHGKNLFISTQKSWLQGSSKDRNVIEMYRPVIDRMLAAQNGHLDMFVRFLVGLVTPGTEDNLHGYLLNHYHPKAKGTEDLVKYINKKMKENIHPDRYRNLELCLVELEEGKDKK